LFGVILAGLTTPAMALEDSAPSVTTEDRARFLKRLKEISLPPVVSYNQATAMASSAVNYNRSPMPLSGMPLPLKQHDVEETPRNN